MDELHAWELQGDEMQGESRFTGSIIVERHSSDIQRDQMEG